MLRRRWKAIRIWVTKAILDEWTSSIRDLSQHQMESRGTPKVPVKEETWSNMV